MPKAFGDSTSWSSKIHIWNLHVISTLARIRPTCSESNGLYSLCWVCWVLIISWLLDIFFFFTKVKWNFKRCIAVYALVVIKSISRFNLIRVWYKNDHRGLVPYCPVHHAEGLTWDPTWGGECGMERNWCTLPFCIIACPLDHPNSFINGLQIQLCYIWKRFQFEQMIQTIQMSANTWNSVQFGGGLCVWPARIIDQAGATTSHTRWSLRPNIGIIYNGFNASFLQPRPNLGLLWNSFVHFQLGAITRKILKCFETSALVVKYM